MHNELKMGRTKPLKRLNIAIDLDGVCAAFDTGFIRVAAALFPDRDWIGYEPSDWDWSDRLSAEELTQVWREIVATKGFWVNLPPIKESVSQLYLNAFESAGPLYKANIYFVTSRVETVGASALQQTTWWLADHDLTNSNHSVLVVGLGKSKAKLYEHLDISMSLDDKVQNVVDANQLKGHSAFLFPASHNKKAPANLARASMKQFLELVMARLAGLEGSPHPALSVHSQK